MTHKREKPVEALQREALWSLSEVGCMLDLDRKAVAAVAEKLGLIPTPMPGRAKGLTRVQIDRIRAALDIPAKP